MSKVITPDGIELEVRRIGAITNNRVPMTLCGYGDACGLITQRTVSNCVLDLGSVGIRSNITVEISLSLTCGPDSISGRCAAIMEATLIFPPEHMHRPYWGTVNAVRSG